MGTAYLIPTFLYDNNYESLPLYVLNTIKNCTHFFVENEKTTRRFFKGWDKTIEIIPENWFVIHKNEEQVLQQLTTLIKEGKNIGIVSEAGCPGIADPGQVLVKKVQELGGKVKPLVGPSSILLALMASGMNGQQFQFNGYLPVETSERKKKLIQLEEYSRRNNCSQIFIETPYRNNQLIKEVAQTCNNHTLFCIATNITAPNESIVTKTIAEWKKGLPDIHKQLSIFIIHAEN